MITHETHLERISDMPKRRKSVQQILTQYRVTVQRLREVESELSKIQKECPEKTGCYLQYGWEFIKPYGHGFPIARNVDDCEHTLADFFTDEANRLLKEREELLKRLYRLASRFYELSQNAVSLTSLYPHLRKPWFEVHL